MSEQSPTTPNNKNKPEPSGPKSSETKSHLSKQQQQNAQQQNPKQPSKQQQQQQQQQTPNLLKRWRMTRQNISQNLQETFSVSSKSFINPSSQSQYVNKAAIEREESSLPPPPKKMIWARDEVTREWRLKKQEEGEKKKKEEVKIVVEKLVEEEKEDKKEQEKEKEKEDVDDDGEEEERESESEEEVVTVEDLTINSQKETEEAKSQEPQEDNDSAIFRPRSNSINSNGLPPTHPVTSNLHPSYIPLSLPNHPPTSKDSYSKGSKSKTSGGGEDTWSLISESGDNKSNSSSGIIVSLSSSIRSSSFGNKNNGGAAAAAAAPIQLPPIPLERSWSSSTIASNDETGYGIPGVDYIEHVVLPTDTLEGICLAYKISRTRLRQANYFSGSTLLLAPKKLIIPLSKKAFKEAAGEVGRVKRQNTSTEVYKVQAFLAEVGGGMSSSEARTYLDLSNWDVDEALRTAYEDLAWEKHKKQKSKSSTAGQQELRITLSLHPKNKSNNGKLLQKSDDLTSLNIHHSHYDYKRKKDDDGKGKEEWDEEDNFSEVDASGVSNESVMTASVRNSTAIGGGAVDNHGAKCVTLQDVYQASLSHDLCGVELKEISSPPTSEKPDVVVVADKAPSSSSSRMPSFPLPRI